MLWWAQGPYHPAQGANGRASLKYPSEINAQPFKVQLLGTNGYANVATANNTNGSSYGFLHNNVAKSISLYRPKMAGKDGSFHYCEVRSVKGQDNATCFVVCPNPSSGNAKPMPSDVAEGTEVLLPDNTGRRSIQFTPKKQPCRCFDRPATRRSHHKGGSTRQRGGPQAIAPSLTIALHIQKGCTATGQLFLYL